MSSTRQRPKIVFPSDEEVAAISAHKRRFEESDENRKKFRKAIDEEIAIPPIKPAAKHPTSIIDDDLMTIPADIILQWSTKVRSAGAKHMLTIGQPDPVPKSALEVYTRAVADEDRRVRTSYPSLHGKRELRENIIRLEKNFNVQMDPEEDLGRIFITSGACQALQMVFRLFKEGSEILVQSPGFGSVYSLIAQGYAKGVGCEYFVGGKFSKEKMDGKFSPHTKAAYLNVPSNPTGQMPDEGEIRKFANYCVERGILMICDSPYKYLMHSGKYFSPLNMGGEAAEFTTEVSSFSKIFKPDIRLGYMRLSPKIFDPNVFRIEEIFGNITPGVPRSIAAGINALLKDDPHLDFIKPVMEGYRRKIDLSTGHLRRMGCELTLTPQAGYLMFPRTPDGVDGESFVQEMAAKHGVGFLPGSAFNGGIRKYGPYFRVSVGGGITEVELDRILGSLHN
jgi:(5-formylfuran-3-yl)methyl phosphate transaminase